MTFRCKESIYSSGCGEELEYYDPGNGARKIVIETSRKPDLIKHVCPNAKPFQKSARQVAITESRSPPTQHQNWTSTKNESIQLMHDEKTELTKIYHKLLQRQNELKERELDLYQREVEARERYNEIQSTLNAEVLEDRNNVTGTA